MESYTDFLDFEVEQFYNIDDNKVIELWNEYCEKNLLDEKIFLMEKFDDIVGTNPKFIVDKRLFKKNCKYFSINGYHYFYSFNDIYGSRCPINFYDLAEFYADLDEDYDGNFKYWANLSLEEIVENVELSTFFEGYFSTWFDVSKFDKYSYIGDLEEDFNAYLRSIGIDFEDD